MSSESAAVTGNAAAGTGRRTAIVTGGSRGIGRAIVLALAAERFNVVINYVKNVAAAEQVGRDVEKLGGRAHLVQADIGVAADRQKLVLQSAVTFGPIDMLVNNAGVAPDIRADVLEAGEQSFDRVINVNLKGPYFLTQLVARRMIDQVGHIPGGAASATAKPKIINIGSVSAYAASTNRGEYCIAKAGLAMLTTVFAARLAEYGINVYEIRPGIIETDMTGPVKSKYDKLIFEQDLTPLRRWGCAEDVARAVVAIAKDLLPFSTGEVINVDGGFHLRRL